MYAPSSTRFDALVADELKQQQQDTNNTTTDLGATTGSAAGSAAGRAAGSAAGNAASSRHRLVRVHPSFRVIALGIPGETETYIHTYMPFGKN